MNKVVAVLVIIGLVGVLGFGSVLEHVDRIGDLTRQYTSIVQWATDSPYARYLEAAEQMRYVVDRAEAEILAAMLEAKTAFEAKVVLATMYGVVGMRVGADGMKELDVDKLTVATYLLEYSSSCISELLP